MSFAESAASQIGPSIFDDLTIDIGECAPCCCQAECFGNSHLFLQVNSLLRVLTAVPFGSTKSTTPIMASTSTTPTTTTTMPTHKTCGICTESVPRHLFQKKEYRLTDRSPTCHNCKRTLTANRIKQKPPPSQGTLQGRVAESGMVRRPNNFGHCDYIDMLFGMKCFPDLVSLGVFRSAKDVSESMAVLQGVMRHGNFNSTSKSNVLCLCIGDGCTPRTAVLACYLQGWTCVSIDPALNEEWSGNNPKDVN